MSTRRLRARLERLEKGLSSTPRETKDPASYFKIDPDLAQAIWKDWKRLHQVAPCFMWRGPLFKDQEPKEALALEARIIERARTISCPASYGYNEFLDDKQRLCFFREDLPPWFAHLKLNIVGNPDDVEAQLVARIEAFKQTPEGRKRDRLSELE